jgi:DNA-binding response OmpR family regulator
LKVLVVDNDRKLADSISSALEQAQVQYAPNGDIAVMMALQNRFDVIVLDATLADQDGVVVLQELRRRQVVTPVLMLAADDSVRNVVLSLDAGANDCVSKPCQINVLVARLRALMRRSKWDSCTDIGFAQGRPEGVVSILIAGDYESSRAAMARLIALRLPEAVVHVADSHRNITELCAIHMVDIVVTDLKKSPEALQKIIAEIRAVRNNVRFIVTTGSIEKDQPVRIACLEDCCVLRKPVNLEELLRAIRRSIAESGAAAAPAPTAASL